MIFQVLDRGHTMGKRTKKLMEIISDPEKLAKLEQELEAARALKSEECQCGRVKRRRHAFCYPCWSRLPRELHSGLRLEVGEGFEETYHQALAWLKKD